MTWKDKLELGIKEDAAFRKDNLPENQVRGPEIPAGPGRSPEIPLARGDKNQVPASVAEPEVTAANEAEREAQVTQIIQRLEHIEAEAARLREELARLKSGESKGADKDP
jgi:hypothetical protein